MQANLKDWLMLAALGLIWGAAFPLTGVATADFTPLTLAAGRLVIGALALMTVLALRGQSLPGLAERRFWAFALASAIVTNAMPFTLLSWAQRHVDAGFAGVAVATVPLFVLPLAHLFIAGERMTWRKLTGFSVGFIGIVVLIGPEVLAGLGGSGLMVLAQLACIATAFCYASGSIIAKRAPDLGLIPFGAAGLLLAALLSVPLALVVEGTPALPSMGGSLALLYLGLVPTGFATVLLLSVIASAGPSFLSMVNYQIPVWAVLLSILFLGEDPSPRLGIALVIIFLGLAISQGVTGLRRGGHARG
ncbi:MAG: DMT family transporter [Pseudomonadota bacterium]